MEVNTNDSRKEKRTSFLFPWDADKMMCAYYKLHPEEPQLKEIGPIACQRDQDQSEDHKEVPKTKPASIEEKP